MGGAVVLKDLGKVATEYLGKAWDKVWEPSAASAVYESGEAMLRRSGPFGEALNGALQAYKDRSGLRIGEMLKYRMPLFRSAYDSKVAGQVVDDLEGTARASHPAARDLADYDRILNEALYQEAPRHGITPGPRVPDDFHRMWDPELFRGQRYEQMIDHLVKTGQAPTRNQARELLDKVRPRMGAGRVHTLETGRIVDLPNYRKDLAVMQDHFVNVLRRFTSADIFGPKDENLHALIDQIESTSGKAAARQANLIASNILGRGVGSVSDLEQVIGHGYYRKIASIETLSHLSLAWMKHAGQFLNSVVVGGRSGLGPVVRAVGDMIVDHGNAKSFAIRSGATMLETLHDVRRLAGAEAETLGGRLLRYTPFKFIDRMRRVFAARLGAHAVQDEYTKWLADPSNRKVTLNLRLMGIDPNDVKKAGGLKDYHVALAAKRLSDVTQFTSDALTLPPSWLASDNWAIRLSVMFKQFFFHQARFVKDQVLKPAIYQGEFRPLIYMSLLFPTFGEVVADINEWARKGTLQERPKPADWADRAIDNYAAIGGFGIMHDLVNAFAQPDESAAFRFVVGPVISDVVDLSHVPFAAHPMKEVERRIVRSIPVVGPQTSRRVFPPAKPGTRGPLQRGEVTKRIRKIVRSISE